MKRSTITARLEQLRAALRAENVSYGELAELQSMSKHIAPDDPELLEVAGVPEEVYNARLNAASKRSRAEKNTKHQAARRAARKARRFASLLRRGEAYTTEVTRRDKAMRELDKLARGVK